MSAAMLEGLHAMPSTSLRTTRPVLVQHRQGSPVAVRRRAPGSRVRCAPVVAVAAVTALLIAPGAVAAATGPVPPSPDDSTGFVTPVVALAAIVGVSIVFIWFPRSRRWISAACILGATGIAAFAVLFIGTVGGWAGQPTAPWTVPAAIVVVVAGLVLATVTLVRFPRRLRE